MKNLLNEFWTTPIPEFIANRFKPLGDYIISKVTKEQLDQKEYILRSIIFGVTCLVLFLLLSGTINPLDIFFEIPLFSVSDFIATLPYDAIEAGVMYFICTAVLISFSLSIVRIFLLNNESYPIYTLEGLSYWFMALNISFLCDKASQQIVRLVNQYVIDHYSYLMMLLVIIIFVFFLYYVFDGEMFALDISITFAPTICHALNFDFLNLAIVELVVVSIILNIILLILNKLHVLDVIIDFFKKWLYTPKYLLFWWYGLFLLPVRLFKWFFRIDSKKTR